MGYISSEAVSKRHPDKLADEVADAILSAYLAQDPKTHAGIEVLLKAGNCALSGEVSGVANVNCAKIARDTLKRLEPWNPPYHVINLMRKQSSEIRDAVNTAKGTAAGDQGTMTGAWFATPDGFPFEFTLAKEIMHYIDRYVDNAPTGFLRGDAKAQVTVDSDARSLLGLKRVLVSACANPSFYADQSTIDDFREELRRGIQHYLNDKYGIWIDDEIFDINPAGKWTIGGPDADCGLTGRKTVCDAYGGSVAVGGGAQCGKDLSKVDRSAFLFSRVVAESVWTQLQEEGILSSEVVVNLGYAIGELKPVSIEIKSLEDGSWEDYTDDFADEYDFTPDGMANYLMASELFKPNGLGLWENEHGCK